MTPRYASQSYVLAPVWVRGNTLNTWSRKSPAELQFGDPKGTEYEYENIYGDRYPMNAARTKYLTTFEAIQLKITNTLTAA